jgi:glutaredoxin
MKPKAPRITLYSTRQCSYCRQVKAYLRQHNIPFSEQDVERNRRAMLEFQRAGGRGVPMLMIGPQRVDGYQPKQLYKLLRQAGFDVR